MSTVDTIFFLTHFLADSEDLKRKTRERVIQIRREGAVIPSIVLHEVYKFEIETVGRDAADIRVNSILNSGCTIAIAMSAHYVQQFLSLRVMRQVALKTSSRPSTLRRQRI